jgi:sulfate adenylyltransferase subunit 1 (EFTu-like GTPase family)
VGFAPGPFGEIVSELRDVLGDARIQAVPISALYGDNVTTRSERTPWYDGPALLEYIETVRVEVGESHQPFRYPVQLVLRPNDAFRGYAGRILSGAIRVGDAVTAWPSGRTTRVRRIVTRGRDLDAATSPMSVVLTLEDDVDLSRGDALTVGEPAIASRFEAQIVWMDERALDPKRIYLLKHTTRTVTAEVDRGLSLNEIGTVTVSSSRPLIHEQYCRHRTMGSFVLIDPETNFTAGAGMIGQSLDATRTPGARAGAAERLAELARGAASDGAAADAIRLALEELLR